MTWAEFKRRMEAKGVRDDDEISYIDVAFDWDDETIRVSIAQLKDRRYVEVS